MQMRVTRRLFFVAVPGLILAALAIVASICALSPSPEMKSLLWLPPSLASWADLQPTFRNFPAFGAISLFATLFAHGLFRSVTVFCAVSVTLLVSVFSTVLEAMQLFIPSRYFEWADIGWSIAGAGAGTLVGILILSLPFCFLPEARDLPNKRLFQPIQ